MMEVLDNDEEIDEVAMVMKERKVDSGLMKFFKKGFYALSKGLHSIYGTDKDGQDYIYNVYPFTLKSREGNRYTFTATNSMDDAGSFKVCYRLFPKNENLPHRQDFCYVKWFA